MTVKANERLFRILHRRGMVEGQTVRCSIISGGRPRCPFAVWVDGWESSWGSAGYPRVDVFDLPSCAVVDSSDPARYGEPPTCEDSCPHCAEVQP